MSKWDILSNITAYIVKCLPYCSATPLKQHEVRWKLMAVKSLHPLQFGFHLVLVAFNVLRVNTYDWILKIKGMVKLTV